ncbi:MAG: hypothetical protein ACJ8EL_14745 [Rhizomicrobium sp.]
MDRKRGVKRHKRRRAEAEQGLSKHKRLHELLGQLGNNQISVKTFLNLMNEAGLIVADIDSYCRVEGRWISPEAYLRRCAS